MLKENKLKQIDINKKERLSIKISRLGWIIIK